jgi:hypothetical protein
VLRLTAKNLITNAIKFTRLEEIRRICVSLGISREQPTHSMNGNVPFHRTSETSEAETLQADWEKGGIVRIVARIPVEHANDQRFT